MTVEIAWPTASPAELTEVAALLRAGDLSSVELTETMLDRIAAHDGALKSYQHIMAESALAEAKQAETEIASGTSEASFTGSRWR